VSPARRTVTGVSADRLQTSRMVVTYGTRARAGARQQSTCQ
jgi:hypothetical protein